MKTKTPFRHYLSFLGRYLGLQRLRVSMLAALVLIATGLELVAPQIVRSFIDSALAGGLPDTLARIALLFIGVALLQQLIAVATTYVTEVVSWTATNALRADLALHCLRLDMEFHKQHTTGALIERIDGDVAALANFFSLFVIRVVANLLLLVGVLIVLYAVDWRIGLMFTAAALLTLILLGSMRDFALPLWEMARQASADLFGFLEERLAGTEDIRANGAVAYVMGCFYRLMRQRLQAERKAAIMSSVAVALRLVMEVLGVVVALSLGAFLFQAGAISLGTVYLLVYYNRILHGPLEQIMNEVRDLQQAGASVGRILALLRTRSRIQDRDGAADSVPPGALALEFRDVSFGYPRPPAADAARSSSDLGAPIDDLWPATYGPRAMPELVLRGLSFRLEPGRVLGLIGRTGSGKTTIARLIARLYDPTAGQVLLGGVDVRAARLADLRRRVGVVTQDVQLFQGSVRDNLTFFDRGVPDRRILDVIDHLGLGEWYETLGDGLDTAILSSGGGLSAGEAQILAFIRIFLKDPGLVVLDEASSRLDPTTERLIERAVATLLAGRTGIIIAHRLATVQRVDEILILGSDGAIVEHGERALLVDDPRSRLSQLLQAGMEKALV